ncbi:hypothetical protein [Halomontanus rarus]|uniref:hypothetical protein n=1 Tax=Halomontanus rarus TaxID=3034020 RepID=UPI001A98D056
MPRSNRDRFWDVICAFSNAIYALFVIGFILLSFTLLSLINYELLPRAGQIMTLANLVFVTILIVMSGSVLYRCRN